MTDNAALSINFEAGELATATKRRRGRRRWVEHLVCDISLATAGMSVASAIYKPPAGVFVGHQRAYYASVVAAGVVGLAEAWAAVVWLSGAGSAEATDGQRQLLVRRCVLCASLLPLAFMAGLGGIRILVK